MIMVIIIIIMKMMISVSVIWSDHPADDHDHDHNYDYDDKNGAVTTINNQDIGMIFLHQIICVECSIKPDLECNV